MTAFIGIESDWSPGDPAPASACREYPLLNKDGYGERRNSRPRMVHRWVMAQLHGKEGIEGKVVLHKCDNRACYRLDHLVLSDRASNNLDMALKGRHGRRGLRKTHCTNGHRFSEENTYWVEDPRGTYQRCRECGRKAAREYQQRRRRS